MILSLSIPACVCACVRVFTVMRCMYTCLVDLSSMCMICAHVYVRASDFACVHVHLTTPVCIHANVCVHLLNNNKSSHIFRCLFSLFLCPSSIRRMIFRISRCPTSTLGLPFPLAPNYTSSSCMYAPDVFVRGGEMVIGGHLTESPAEPFCKARLLGHYPDQSYNVSVTFFSVQVHKKENYRYLITGLRAL